MTKWKKILGISLLALMAAFARMTISEARDTVGPFEIALRFTPQESVASSTPNLGLGITDRPIKVVLEDGRAGSDPAVIGESSDDDDKLWPVRATNPVVPPAAPPVTPAALLTELVKLQKQGFDTDLLIDYVNKKTVSPALSADDMVKWKQAGMPPEVIKAALARGGA
jgi:hypothetical protein